MALRTALKTSSDLERERIGLRETHKYTLTKDVHGIGFAAADKIAQTVVIPRDSQNRARTGSSSKVNRFCLELVINFRVGGKVNNKI